jgi:hypothetical protein
MKVTEDFFKGPLDSFGQRYGSEDPYPYQNVTDPEHCLQVSINLLR